MSRLESKRYYEVFISEKIIKCCGYQGLNRPFYLSTVYDSRMTSVSKIYYNKS